MLATLRGDLPGALRLHILGPPLVIGSVWVLIQHVLYRKRCRPVLWGPWIVGFTLIAMVYWLIRLAQPGLWPL